MRAQAWNVYLRGKLIDTVFFDHDMKAWDVERALIHHDGYPSNIAVKRSN
jgi:hypothetical protein